MTSKKHEKILYSRHWVKRIMLQPNSCSNIARILQRGWLHAFHVIYEFSFNLFLFSYVPRSWGKDLAGMQAIAVLILQISLLDTGPEISRGLTEV